MSAARRRMDPLLRRNDVVSVSLNGGEYEMLERLLERAGFASPGEAFRYLLRVEDERAREESE